MIRYRYTLLLTLALLAAPALAQGQQEDKRPKLGVAEVKTNPSIEASAKTASLSRSREAMDGRLIDRLHNTRKFRVIARSDLDAIFKEQDFQASGAVDSNTAGEAFAISGLDYLVVTTIDDYQDFVEPATFAGTGEQAERRIIRLGVVVKIYDASSGELLESASLQLGPGDPDYKKLRDISDVRSYTQTSGKLSDALLVKASQIMADRVSNRVLDVLFPAKVLAKTDSQVMINRGDGTDIVAGQTWAVYALGPEMIDPDTGISLGREEVKVGTVKVTDVQPLFARAEVLEDTGIDKGQVLRMVSDAPGQD